jgi:hypothetical protein
MVNENVKKVVQPKKRRFTFLSYFFCAALAGKNKIKIYFLIIFENF